MEMVWRDLESGVSKALTHFGETSSTDVRTLVFSTRLLLTDPRPGNSSLQTSPSLRRLFTSRWDDGRDHPSHEVSNLE